jgi:hypothetical protein
MEPLPASALRWCCGPNLFEFATTEQFKKLDCVFGQHRAVEAVRSLTLNDCWSSRLRGRD